MKFHTISRTTFLSALILGLTILSPISAKAGITAGQKAEVVAGPANGQVIMTDQSGTSVVCSNEVGAIVCPTNAQAKGGAAPGSVGGVGVGSPLKAGSALTARDSIDLMVKQPGGSGITFGTGAQSN